MPKRTVAAASQRGRNRVRGAHASGKRAIQTPAPDFAYGVPVPVGLHDAIERERDNLGKAESLLGCLVIALEHGGDAATAPYYPDVADMARTLVRSSINGLDSLSLQRVLLRGKVEEPRCLAPLRAPPLSNVAPMTTASLIVAKVKPVRALHRRPYSGRRLRPALIGGSPGISHIDTPGRSIRVSS